MKLELWLMSGQLHQSRHLMVMAEPLVTNHTFVLGFLFWHPFATFQTSCQQHESITLEQVHLSAILPTNAVQIELYMCV